MRVKQVSRVGRSSIKTKPVSRSNPILKHRLQNTQLQKLDKQTETKRKALTVRENGRAIKHYLEYYSKGITVKNALDKSLKVDIERARTQLRAFYIKTLQKDVFKFTVKSSGLYPETHHQVEIMWQLDKANLDKPIQEIFANTPIKAQCSCGRHTYWYRYLWTTAKSSLGLQEHRFPSIRNKNLEGMCCKHMIKVMTSIQSGGFQVTFGRYIENKRLQKGTRLSAKDKVRIAGKSFGAGR